MMSHSESRAAGLGAVRITWIAATAVCALAIVVGLLAGTDARDASQRLPGFAFTEGADPSQQLPDLASLDPIDALLNVVGRKAHGKPGKTEIGGRQGDRGNAVGQQAPENSQPRARIPDRSGSRQPERSAGRSPSSSPGPTAGPGPSVDAPSLPKAPMVNTPSASPPSVSPASATAPPPPETSVSVNTSPPSVSADVSSPVETAAAKDVNVSVGLP